MKKSHSHALIFTCAIMGLILPLALFVNPLKNKDKVMFKLNVLDATNNFKKLKGKVNDLGNGTADFIGGETRESGQSTNVENETTGRTTNQPETGLDENYSEQNQTGNDDSSIRSYSQNADGTKQKTLSNQSTSTYRIDCYSGSVGFINVRSIPKIGQRRDRLNHDEYTLLEGRCGDVIDVYPSTYTNQGIVWRKVIYQGQTGYIAANSIVK